VRGWGVIACLLSSAVVGEGSVEGSSPLATCSLFEVVVRHFDRGHLSPPASLVTCLLFGAVVRHFDRGPLSPPALPDGAARGVSL
jgi:hypothetical protein